MNLTFDIAGSQIDGARDYQEDAFLVTNLSEGKDDGSLLIVADGMGGHAAGNVASNMAVQSFNRNLTRNFPSDEMNNVLYESVIKANNAIAETIKETPALQGMGCTMVGVLFTGTHMRWASVGDSHLYLIRNKELVKKNADHSYGGFLDRMAAEGTPIEAEEGFSRNMLMSALTGDEIADVDCPETPMELQHGDRIVIASDGLDTLSPGKVLYYAKSSETAKECVNALLEAVEEANIPRQDNTTVLVVDVCDKEAKPTQAEIDMRDDEEDERDTEDRAAMESPLEKTQQPDHPAASEYEDDDEPVTEQAVQAEPIPLEKKTEPPPAYDDEPDYHEDEVAPEATRPPSSGKGLNIAIIIVVALVAGGLAFFLTGDIEFNLRRLPDGYEEAPTDGDTDGGDAEIADEDGTPDPVEPDTTAPAPVVDTTPPPDLGTAPVTTPRVVAPTIPTTPGIGTGEYFKDKLGSGGFAPEMAWIPAGTFTMGGASHSLSYDERPPHTVSIAKIAMSKYEITIAEYATFANATSRKLRSRQGIDQETYPMVYVSWNDALAYVKWLSKQTGKKYRLPTESEWEYAARGGTSGSEYQYWWGREIGKNKAHCRGCGTRFDMQSPTMIGSFKANPYGLFDTAGNVSEWVKDCYHRNYEEAPEDGSVFEGGDCSVRVTRGGSYGNTPKSLRSAKRFKFQANLGSDEIGIRIVRE